MNVDAILLCLAALPALGLAVAGPPDPYRQRRERLMAKLGSGLVLVRGAAEGEVNENFRYLTGLAEPRGALLLAPQGTRVETGRKYPGRDYQRGRIVRQIVFLPARDPLAARWGEDSSSTAESASPQALGVDAVYAAGDLNDVLSRALQDARVLHYVRSGAPALGGPVDLDAVFVEDVRRRFFDTTIQDATPTVHAMRRLKEADEVRRMEDAVVVTREAVEHVMLTARPGMKEYELEAEIFRIYRSKGAGLAFETIVASGPNANLGHYRENSRTIEPGDLVLVDTGASFYGYKSDVTRTFPAGGRFTPRQREIYQVVLRAEREAIALAKPGAKIEDIHAKAYDVIDAAGFGKYFYHGTSHYLGLDTHDVGDYWVPLEAGAVITVEPGIYIPEEGIGVRIEDDVLVTENGHRVLTESIPKEVSEIERLTAP